MDIVIAIAGLVAAGAVGAVGLGYANQVTLRSGVQGAPGLTVTQTIAANVQKALAAGIISGTNPIATGLTATQAITYRQEGFPIIGDAAYPPGPNWHTNVRTTGNAPTPPPVPTQPTSHPADSENSTGIADAVSAGATSADISSELAREAAASQADAWRRALSNGAA